MVLTWGIVALLRHRLVMRTRMGIGSRLRRRRNSLDRLALPSTANRNAVAAHQRASAHGPGCYGGVAGDFHLLELECGGLPWY
jgi:hypothetical protein